MSSMKQPQIIESSPSIQSSGTRNSKNPLPFSRHIGTRYLKDLLRRVGTSLCAGVDARRVWSQEASRGPAHQREIFATICARINEGDSLAEAIDATGSYFPSLVREMVRFGESAGRLDQVLLRLADHYEHTLQLRRSFLMGIAWPAIQLCVAVLVIGLLIWIFGWISARGDGTPIDPLGLGLVGTSGLIIYFLLIGTLVSGVAMAWFAMRQGWFGSLPSEIAVRIPIIGHCWKTAALSRLTWTLSLALESGLDARRSLSLALASTQLPYYQDIAGDADEVVLRGGEFHEALRCRDRLPDEFLDSLAAAEHAGSAAEALEVLSRDYTERSIMANRMLTAAASFAVWGFVASIIIFFIFRLAMFYLGTINEALQGL
jgi:type II secretory pathway component PulF